MLQFRKGKAAFALCTAAVCAAAAAPATVPAAAYGSGYEMVEWLSRGISAISTPQGMLVSWRFNADDADDAEFRLYRGDVLIYTSLAGMATSYLDRDGSAAAEYRVDTVTDGVVTASEYCTLTSQHDYFDIPLDVPQGNGCTYSANDCSCGDVDGDGMYEIFVKWDPSNAQDNSKSGYTGNVYIDCYKLDGRKLWRIDLGRNIRAGAHYTQYVVGDFDLDGKAEMACKTADGTVDGKGAVIGNANADYRNDGGYILAGPEFYTLFDGATGAALDTVMYEYPRGDVSAWGDKYGNRVDRFLGAAAYLDGVKPSIVSVRGYYTRMTVVAYDVIDKKLVKRWGYDSGNNSSAAGYGNGNHNCMPADVDGDGRQEIVLGATCIDDNGSVLWCNNKGHGDAMHLGDLLPNREGLELWVCHEHAPFGVSLLDARTGETIFHYNDPTGKDTGRCGAGNILAGNDSAEFWGARQPSVYNGAGQAVSSKIPAMNFLIYWDGDLEREIQDNISITKMTNASTIETLLEASGCASCNGTKATPNLTADLFGDWREELVLHTADSRYLRIFSTPYSTDVRLTTLMHDTQYRAQVATEQNCYNQPAHPSFFLGTEFDLPSRPNVRVLGSDWEHAGTEPVVPTIPDYYNGEVNDFLLGDLNHDGLVNASDFTLLRRHLMKPFLIRTDKPRADVSGDGTISMADLVEMQRYLTNQGGFTAYDSGKSFCYAVDARWMLGVTETTNAGFEGSAYVNLDNVVGSYIEFTIYAARAGTYTCDLRFANGSADDRPMDISVNGNAAEKISFPSTGAWTTWQNGSFGVELKQGENKIRMTSVTSQGGPNIDWLSTGLAVPPM